MMIPRGFCGQGRIRDGRIDEEEKGEGGERVGIEGGNL